VYFLQFFYFCGSSHLAVVYYHRVKLSLLRGTVWKILKNAAANFLQPFLTPRQYCQSTHCTAYNTDTKCHVVTITR